MLTTLHPFFALGEALLRKVHAKMNISSSCFVGFGLKLNWNQGNTEAFVVFRRAGATEAKNSPSLRKWFVCEESNWIVVTSFA